MFHFLYQLLHNRYKRIITNLKFTTINSCISFKIYRILTYIRFIFIEPKVINMKSTIPFVAIILVFGLLLPGCGDGITLYPAKGTIVLDNGKPVTQGMIECESIDNPKKLNASASIQKDGSFELECMGKKGAVAGKHKVTLIEPPGNSDLPLNQQPKPQFDTKYRGYDTTDLIITINPVSENNLNLKVKPAK